MFVSIKDYPVHSRVLFRKNAVSLLEIKAEILSKYMFTQACQENKECVPIDHG